MKKLFILITAGIFAIAMGGCFKNTEDVPSQNSTKEVYQGEGWQSKFYDPKTMKGMSINLYGVTDNSKILRVFEEDTGIKVESLIMKNGEILERLKNEKESGINIADIWFTGGADTFIEGAQNDLLLAYKSSEAEAIDSKMKDPDGYWTGTSLTLVNWVVNTDLIEKKGLKIPQVWDDLLQEGFKNEVSMSNPASSGTAYNVVSAMLEVKGEEKGWKYLDKLIGQVPFFTLRGSDPANNVINGEAIVGINASNGDREIEKNNPNIKVIYPSDGTGWWPQPVAVVKGTKNEAAAKVFIDWIVSKRGMQTMADIRYAAVARKDVEKPEGIIDIDTIKLFDTDFMANAKNREGILKIWAEKVNAAGR